MADLLSSDFRGPTSAKAAQKAAVQTRDALTAGGKSAAVKAPAAAANNAVKLKNGGTYQHRLNTADRLEAIEHKVGDKATGLAFFDGFALPIAMFIGGMTGKIPVVGPHLRTALAGPFMAFSRSMQMTKFSDGLRWPANFIHEWTSFSKEVHGKQGSLAKGIKSLSDTLGQNISSEVATRDTHAFSRELLKDFSHVTPKGKATWAMKRAEKIRAQKVEKVANEAKAIADSLQRPHNGATTSFKEGFANIKSKITGKKTMTVKVENTIPTPAELKRIEDAALSLHHAASGDAAHVDYGHMIGRLEDLHHEMHEAQRAGITDRSVSKRLGKVRNSAEELTQAAESSVFQHARANGAPMKALAGRTAQNFGQMSMQSAALKGGFGVASVGMAGKTALHVKQHLYNLKEIYGGLTGKDPHRISTYEVLFSKKVPPVVAQARHGLMKHFGPEIMADLGGLAANAAFILGKGGMTLGFGGIGMQMMSSNLTDGNDILESYAELKEMEAAGADVPAEKYAEIIGNSSKSAAMHGGAKNPLTNRIAQEYKAEGLGLAAILHEINDGKPFNDRALHLEKTMAAERLAAKESAKKPAGDSKSPTGKILTSHAAGVGTVNHAATKAVNDNATPSLKMQSNAVEHQGKLAEASREMGGNA